MKKYLERKQNTDNIYDSGSTGTEQMRGKAEAFVFILYYIFRCLIYVNISATQTLN